MWDVPYSPNQFLGWDFFCCLSKTALIQSSTRDHTITKINQLPSYCNYTISYEVNLHCSPRPYLFPIRKKYPTGFCFLSHVQYSQSHILKYLELFFWFHDKSLAPTYIQSEKNIQQVFISIFQYQELTIFYILWNLCPKILCKYWKSIWIYFQIS